MTSFIQFLRSVISNLRPAHLIVAAVVVLFGLRSMGGFSVLPRSMSGAPSRMTTAAQVECFDHYRFGSVQAQLTTPLASAASGTTMSFSGTISNSNPYPIVDGALYVKIMKSRGGVNDGNGPDVVDQFIVRSDISIAANGSLPVDFQWAVPAYAQSGDYTLATFFTTSRKFNLLGLSFTDDVVGNTVPFKVVGEASGGVQFDKASVTVNGRPYYFAAFPPRTYTTEPVEVVARLVNTSAAKEAAEVSWSVYQWDGQLIENLVQVEEPETAVDVPAHGAATVAVTVSDARYPVYLVVGKVTWRGTTSFIGVRFVRAGLDRPRINFPSLSVFPLLEGEEATLFSCLHNTGSSDVVGGGNVQLVLSDKEGDVIHEARYVGGISGAMMGIESSFTPSRSYDFAVLDAQLFEDGEMIDEAHLVYDCTKIDPTSCAPKTQSSSQVYLWIVAIVIGLWATAATYMAQQWQQGGSTRS